MLFCVCWQSCFANQFLQGFTFECVLSAIKFVMKLAMKLSISHVQVYVLCSGLACMCN